MYNDNGGVTLRGMANGFDTSSVYALRNEEADFEDAADTDSAGAAAGADGGEQHPVAKAISEEAALQRIQSAKEQKAGAKR